VLLSILLGAPVAGCASSPNARASRTKVTSPLRTLPPSAALDELRVQRLRLKEASGPDHIDPAPTIDPQVLVGTGRGVIQRALGMPEVCDPPTCADARTWYFDFYYLPEGSRGGGTVLYLDFDESGTCAHAAWTGYK
jgi:hypothetical protein